MSAPSLVHGLLEEQARSRPDGVLLVHGEERATYAEIEVGANRFARVLLSEGISRPEGEAKCPPDLLEEVFELREAMMEGDADSARAKSETLLAEAESSLNSLYAEYDEAADGEAGRSVLDRVRKALDRRRFLAGLAAETA